MQENKLALFEEKEIRRTWYNEDWYFSVEDVIYALTESANTKDYIKKMKKRNPTLAERWGQFVTLLPLNTMREIKKFMFKYQRNTKNYTINSFSKSGTF